jgi:hypothetical protein
MEKHFSHINLLIIAELKQKYEKRELELLETINEYKHELYTHDIFKCNRCELFMNLSFDIVKCHSCSVYKDICVNCIKTFYCQNCNNEYYCNNCNNKYQIEQCCENNICDKCIKEWRETNECIKCNTKLLCQECCEEDSDGNIICKKCYNK